MVVRRRRAVRTLTRPRNDDPRVAEHALRLPHTRPYDHAALVAFLGTRAVDGVERVDGAAYARTFALDGVPGVLRVSRRGGARAASLDVRVLADDARVLTEVAARLRRVFDMDSDARAIDRHLARDRGLAAHVRARPGLRVPGGWDPFEIAVRAVLGQQISVRAATTIAGRLVARCGAALPIALALAPEGLTHVFPSAEAVAAADPFGLGLTTARARTLHALAAAVARDPAVLAARESREHTIAALVTLPGIGPWTAQYIAMRAHGERDAFPSGDLVLQREAAPRGKHRVTAAELDARALAWRPYRAYAAVRLWARSAENPRPTPKAPRSSR